MHLYMYMYKYIHVHVPTLQYSLISVSCGGWGLLTETDGGAVEGGGETVLFMTVVWWDLKGACVQCGKPPYTITAGGMYTTLHANDVILHVVQLKLMYSN